MPIQAQYLGMGLDLNDLEVENRAAQLVEVLLVGDGGTQTGALLDEHVVAAAGQFVGTRRGEGDAVLVVLDLAGNCDPHDDSSVRACLCLTMWGSRKVMSPCGSHYPVTVRLFSQDKATLNTHAC